MARISRIRRRRRGGSSIEAVLAVPLLLMVVLFMWTVTGLITTKMMLETTAQVAVQTASVIYDHETNSSTLTSNASAQSSATNAASWVLRGLGRPANQGGQLAYITNQGGNPTASCTSQPSLQAIANGNVNSLISFGTPTNPSPSPYITSRVAIRITNLNVPFQRAGFGTLISSCLTASSSSELYK